MKRDAVLILLLVSVVASSFARQPTKADSKTIIVPDDYPTIAAAIANAADGDTLLVRRGTYEGAQNQTLVVNKRIALMGEDANGTTLTFHPAMYEWFIGPVSMGWTWNYSLLILASDVVLSGFTIESDGGHVWANGDRTQIVNNIFKSGLTMNGSYQSFAYNVLSTSMTLSGSHQIFAYNMLSDSLFPNGTIKSHGVVSSSGYYNRFISNTLAKGNIGISGRYNTISANSGEGGIGTGGEARSNLIQNNTVRDGGGIFIAGIENIVANNTITNSPWFGIEIAWGFGNIVKGNMIRNSTDAGLLETDNSGGTVFTGNFVADSVWGAKIVGYQSGGTVLCCNNFVNNAQQVNNEPTENYTVAGSTFTRTLNHSGRFDNGTTGNYWSDYNGVDSNGDGFGDIPYAVGSNRVDRFPLMSPFNISSPTYQLPEWANTTAPTIILTIPSFPPAPTPSPSASPTAAATSSVTASATPSPTFSATAVPSQTSSSTHIPTPTVPATPTPTSTLSSTMPPLSSEPPAQINEKHPEKLSPELAYAVAGAVAAIGLATSLTLLRKRGKQTPLQPEPASTSERDKQRRATYKTAQKSTQRNGNAPAATKSIQFAENKTHRTIFFRLKTLGTQPEIQDTQRRF